MTLFLFCAMVRQKKWTSHSIKRQCNHFCKILTFKLVQYFAIDEITKRHDNTNGNSIEKGDTKNGNTAVYNVVHIPTKCIVVVVIIIMHKHSLKSVVFFVRRESFCMSYIALYNTTLTPCPTIIDDIKWLLSNIILLHYYHSSCYEYGNPQCNIVSYNVIPRVKDTSFCKCFHSVKRNTTIVAISSYQDTMFIENVNTFQEHGTVCI